MRKRCVLAFALSVVGALAILLVVVGRLWLPPADTSLVTGQPCSAPCWHGITPGLSTEEDVYRALRANPRVDYGTVQKGNVSYDESGPLTSIGWTSLVYDWNGVLLRDGKVVVINIHMSRSIGIPDIAPVWSAGPTLGEIVRVWGPPDGVTARATGTDGAYQLDLDFPSRGFSVCCYMMMYPGTHCLTADGKRGLINEKWRVSDVSYYAPTTLRDALHNALFYKSVSVEALLKEERPWPGFGGTVELTEFVRG